MTIVRHIDPQAFLAAAAPLCERSAATDALVRARVLGLERTPPRPDEPHYLATYAGPTAHGLAMHEGRFPVVIEDSDPEAAAAFAADLAGAHPDLTGVVGSLRACEAFAREWRERTGRRHALRVHMRHHALDAVNDVPAAPGSMRVAVEPDGEWLCVAQRAFVVEAKVPAEPADPRADVLRRIGQGRFRIWDDDGPASYLGLTESGPGAARIAPVFTPPERRHRGYATALVAAAAREVLARGVPRLFLVTDVANPTSNAIYARIGFRPLEDTFGFDFVAP